jgi:hypothetical protein
MATGRTKTQPPEHAPRYYPDMPPITPSIRAFRGLPRCQNRSRDSAVLRTTPQQLRWAALALPLVLATACSSAGDEGTEILLPFDSLSGGMVFATRAFVGSNDYDLYWAPVPSAIAAVAQDAFRLTEASGSEWQPAVAGGGSAIAYAKDGEGIFLITSTGRIRRISDTRGTPFVDSIPAVSFDGSRIAWVREDTSRPIGETGYLETYAMVSDFDATNARAVNPKPGVIQDTPAFEPISGSTQIAWSEFNANTSSAQGPVDVGVWIHNFSENTGRFACQGRVVDPVQNLSAPCVGQHLVWPIPQFLVLTQNFLEIPLNSASPAILGPTIVNSILNQQFGIPVLVSNPYGFFPPFPISASYAGPNMVFDGVIDTIDGDFRTLAFFLARPDGTEIRRFAINGLLADFDPLSTRDYTFSVARPQLIP